jgi:hypothetical protein
MMLGLSTTPDVGQIIHASDARRFAAESNGRDGILHSTTRFDGLLDVGNSFETVSTQASYTDVHSKEGGRAGKQNVPTINPRVLELRGKSLRLATICSRWLRDLKELTLKLDYQPTRPASAKRTKVEITGVELLNIDGEDDTLEELYLDPRAIRSLRLHVRDTIRKVVAQLDPACEEYRSVARLIRPDGTNALLEEAPLPGLDAYAKIHRMIKRWQVRALGRAGEEAMRALEGLAGTIAHPSDIEEGLSRFSYLLSLILSTKQGDFLGYRVHTAGTAQQDKAIHLLLKAFRAPPTPAMRGLYKELVEWRGRWRPKRPKIGRMRRTDRFPP